MRSQAARDAAVPDGAAAPLVSVRNLSVTFEGTRRRVAAVRDVSMEIAPGSVVAIVGESGSGKSVTARALVGLAGDDAVVRADELAFGGRDLRAFTRRDWRALRGRRAGLVLQDALGSLDPLRHVGAEVAEVLREHRVVPARELDAEVERLLDAVGVPEPRVRARQYPHELSGGLRQRALIASALAGRPALLIADEPTTALDATVQRQVLDLLKARTADGTAVLLISHDLGVVAEIADHVYVMKDGRFVEDGPARRVLTAPAHPYTRSLVEAVGAGPGELPPVDAAAAPVLRAAKLVKRYRRPGRQVLTAVDAVSLEVRPGETLGVVGESGSGKTTVGRLLMGHVGPDAGAVQLDGRFWRDLRGGDRRRERRRIQMIYQDPLASFDPGYTARRVLEEPLRAVRTPRGERLARVRDLLADVGLGEDVLDRRGRELSGGQRQRLAIARALAASPDVIVCDEPVSALDASIQAQVLEVLLDVQRRTGAAYLFISHDLGVVRRLSHRVVVMKDGRVVESGTMEDVFDRPRHPYTKTLLEAVPQFSM
ncbi:dipeptide ABC transporter ATP-binding protein [Actinomadura sp. 9N215]|uniref:dipeptide ABC transporter ATP-binding protein n=1 Tax=Actinomadura sp. 9N215 TaxID=3375150 RepID=UPI0037A0ED0D